MIANNPLKKRIRTILIAALFVALLAVIFVQQSHIRKLQSRNTQAGDQIFGKPIAQSNLRESTATPRLSQTEAEQHSQARTGDLETVEKQLKDISAPLVEDMASTMFSADIKSGQSLVAGGYPTADGKNQFTFLKPSVVVDRNGGKQIQIDSNLLAMSQEGIKLSGLESLATHAKNTLQHAESWDESDVAATLAKLRNSTDCDHLGQPKVCVTPGDKFSVQMTSDDQSSYTLSGTAELSPDGSGVVLKARIEQKEATQPPSF